MEDHFRYARTTFKCFGFTSQAAKNKPYLSKPEGGALNNWGGGYWTKHLPCTTKEVKSMLSCFHLGAHLTSRYHAFFTKNQTNKQAITTIKKTKIKKSESTPFRKTEMLWSVLLSKQGQINLWQKASNTKTWKV